MARMGRTPLGAADFWAQDLSRRKAITEDAQDAADTYAKYKPNMERLKQPFKTTPQWMAMSADDRKKAVKYSEGTSRSVWQVLKRNYSAADGWAVYKASRKKMGLPLEYTENQFIHFDISKINSLAINATNSAEMYSDTLLDVKPSLTAKDFYALALKDKKRILAKYAPEITYANSCKAVGAKPNWFEFNSKTEAERRKLAILAAYIANNYDTYKALCQKLETSPRSDFLQLAPSKQSGEIGSLKDALWQQRKDTAIKVGTAVVTIAAAILIHQAITSDNNAPASSETKSSYTSKIDRKKFAQEKAKFWASEAERSPYKYSKPNLERMRQGKAPIGRDGFSMELHHKDGTPNGPLAPMTRTDHRIGDNYSKNHPWLFENKRSTPAKGNE